MRKICLFFVGSIIMVGCTPKPAETPVQKFKNGYEFILADYKEKLKEQWHQTMCSD